MGSLAQSEKPMHDLDAVIVGAGVSGIDMAYHLQKQHPGLSYTILENRNNLGGTWDLFKYPGIRSDSDLYTYGFPWRPWTSRASIAAGSAIQEYLTDCAQAYGIDKKFQFNHRVESANWSTKTQKWTLSVLEHSTGEAKTFRTRFLMGCTGYYNYETPLQTTIPGIENFGGKVIHPQFYDPELDHSDKNVVIIGSGATAITLLPALAEKAKHVTMLQRSPSYIMSVPNEDALERAIRAYAPTWLAHKLIRLKWLVVPFLLLSFATYCPSWCRTLVRKTMKDQLPKEIAMDPHFNPSYNVFEQRLCFCPDGDFYAALRGGKASVATGVIENVEKDRIVLADGQVLNPDIIITATGLKLRVAGGINISIDDTPISIPTKFMWQNTMLQDIPNTFFIIGYVNASWTLAAEVASTLICRIIGKMKKEGQAVVTPRVEGELEESSILPLKSSYVKKGMQDVPKASTKPGWAPRTYFFKEMGHAKFGDIQTDLEYLKPNSLT